LTRIYKESIEKNPEYAKIESSPLKGHVSQFKRFPSLANQAMKNKISQRSKYMLMHEVGPLQFKENQQELNMKCKLPKDWHDTSCNNSEHIDNSFNKKSSIDKTLTEKEA